MPKIYSMKPAIISNELMFTVVNKPKNAIINIYNLEVYKKDCKVSCVFWHVSNKEGHNGKLNYAALHEEVIKYGQQFPDMLIKSQPKAIIPGEYTVSGMASINEGRVDCLWWISM